MELVRWNETRPKGAGADMTTVRLAGPARALAPVLRWFRHRPKGEQEAAVAAAVSPPSPLLSASLAHKTARGAGSEGATRCEKVWIEREREKIEEKGRAHTHTRRVGLARAPAPSACKARAGPQGIGPTGGLHTLAGSGVQIY